MSETHGILSLALDFPAVVRTNDFWRRGYPEVLATFESRALARLWTPAEGDVDPATAAFDAEMAPYLGDPFRGAVERRVLGPGETVLQGEARAARRALDAAGLEPEEVGLLISAAFVPDQPGLGQAAFLARELGLRGAAWNLETACSSGLEAVRAAAALVRAGEYRHVLVVTSCMYSKVSDPEDTISLVVGDGAAALVVGEGQAPATIVGGKSVHTGDTCGSMYYELVKADGGEGRMLMRSGRHGGKQLHEAAGKYLLECCHGALAAAGVTLEEIACFVFNTPTAWYARFCARALGVPASKTVDTFPTYGNVGPVLMPANLYEAARQGKLRRGDLVLLYSIGSVSSAGAMVVRWNDVALGAPPQPAIARQ